MLNSRAFNQKETKNFSMLSLIIYVGVVKVLKSRILADPVLVGREHELEELQSFLNSAIAGKGTTVFVSGEAGAGKTRLINEFLNQAKKQEVTILTGWCLSNAAVPYFPFFEAFNAYFSGKENEKTAATLAIRNKESHEEIASKIKENRDIYIKTYDELKKGIGEVYDLQRVANGSVGELKGKVGEIVTRCEERSRVFYQEGEKFKRRKK